MLKAAESNGIESVAFPPMGAGFYGVPIDESAKITIETIAEYLSKGSEIKDVFVCANDTREYRALEPKIKELMKNAA